MNKKLIIEPYKWYTCINNYYMREIELYHKGREYEGVHILYNLPRDTPFEQFFVLSNQGEDETPSTENKEISSDDLKNEDFIEKLSTKIAEKLAAIISKGNFSSRVLKRILPIEPVSPNPLDYPVVMYGVQTNPTTYSTITSEMFPSQRNNANFK